jgi:WD40 repeat protein
MRSRLGILVIVLFLLLLGTSCRSAVSEATASPVASKTPLPNIEPTGTFSPRPVIQATVTAFPSTTPLSTSTVLLTLAPSISPLIIALENADQIQELNSIGSTEIGEILDVAWSPDGRSLAVIGSRSLNLLDAVSMELIWRIPLSPSNPELMFTADSGTLVLDAGRGYATFVDVEQGEITNDIGVDGIFSVSPDGSLLAVTRGGDVSLLDWQADQIVTTLDADINSGAVYDLAFSADGKTLVAGSDHGDVQTWDIKSGYRAPTYFPSIPSEIYSCEVSGSIAGMPSGKLLVVCHSPTSDSWVDYVQIWLWDADDIQNRKYIRTNEDYFRNFYHFTVSADRQKLAVFAGEDVEIWNATGGYPVNLLEGVQGEGLVFNPENSNMLGVWTNSTLQIWDVNTGELLNEFDEPGSISPVTRLVFNPAAPGRQLIIGRSDGLVEMWDVTSEQESTELIDRPSEITGLSFNADGKRLAVSDASQTVLVWDFDNAIPQLQFEIETSDDIYDITLSPEGANLIIAGYSNEVDIWDLSTQSILHTLTTTGYKNTSLAVSNDGKILAIGNSSGVVQLWNLDRYTLLEKMDTKANTDVVDLDFSPDGKQLASLAGKKFQVWEVETGEWIRGWGVDSQQNSLVYSPDQCTLAVSASKVELLDIASGDFFIGFSETTGDIVNASFSPDGYLLAGGSEGGHVGILGVPGGLEAQEIMENVAIRCSSLVPLPTPSPTKTSTITPIPSATESPTVTPVLSVTPTQTETSTPTLPAFDRTLYLSDPPMQGDDITLLQNRLLALGYSEVGIPDGVFGQYSDQAVRHFQQLNNLEIDGVVGPLTWEALFSDDAVGLQP